MNYNKNILSLILYHFPFFHSFNKIYKIFYIFNKNYLFYILIFHTFEDSILEAKTKILIEAYLLNYKQFINTFRKILDKIRSKNV